MGIVYTNNVLALSLSGAGTTYTFTVTSANATVGSVYQDAAGDLFTTQATIASATTLLMSGTTPAAGNAYTFTITSGNATKGSTYTDSNLTVFTTDTTIAGQTSYIANGPLAPAASGTLTKTSGTGDATLTYSIASATTSVYITKVSGTGDAVIAFSADPATTGTYDFTERLNIDSVKLLSGSGAASSLTIADNHSGGNIIYQINAATSSANEYDHGLKIRGGSTGDTFVLTGAGATAYVYLERC